MAYANVHVAGAIRATGYNKTSENIILVTTILIYNKNYLENGIHLRILRTLNTALEFIIKVRNLNNPKPFLTNSILAVAVGENV